MLLALLFLFLIIPSSVFGTQCQLCDSFQGYCDFDGTKCVGPKCSRRTAPMASGLIREQRLCVPSDSPVGCRKAVLWDDVEGLECVCEGHMCNRVAVLTKMITVLAFLIFLF